VLSTFVTVFRYNTTTRFKTPQSKIIVVVFGKSGISPIGFNRRVGKILRDWL
jgi:hypothetical protein